MAPHLSDDEKQRRHAQIVEEQIKLTLATDDLTKEQKALATSLSLVIMQSTYAFAKETKEVMDQGKDIERLILMAFKICVVSIEKDLDLGPVKSNQPRKP